MKYLNGLTCILFMLIFLSSCSSPEEIAQKQLREKGIEATATALIGQAQEGNSENVQLLLTAGVPVDSTDAKGLSALELAASSGQNSVVEVLLTAGADRNRVDKNGNTPLMRSVQMGNVETAEILVKSGARTDILNSLGESALTIALKNKDLAMVTALGQAGVNLDVQVDVGRTILRDIIDSDQEGSNELAIALISGGADINMADNSGQSAFTAAVNKNLVDLVSFMAGKGADINAVVYNDNTYSALMQAIEMKNVELAKVLVEAGADVDFTVEETQESCLYKSVYTQQKAIVELLINAGAKVNTHTVFQATPLSRVTVEPDGKDLEIADILVNAGADINAVASEKGHTLLHVAVMDSDNLLDSLQFLLDKGVATSTYDNDGQTPLTLAVLNNNLEAVKGLIQAGADVNYAAMNGKKPLLVAEELDHYQIAGKLRKAGAKKK